MLKAKLDLSRRRIFNFWYSFDGLPCWLITNVLYNLSQFCLEYEILNGKQNYENNPPSNEVHQHYDNGDQLIDLARIGKFQHA